MRSMLLNQDGWRGLEVISRTEPSVTCWFLHVLGKCMQLLHHPKLCMLECYWQDAKMGHTVPLGLTHAWANLKSLTHQNAERDDRQP